MKKLLWSLAIATPVLMIGCQKEKESSSVDESGEVSVNGVGNGVPSGAHYNLNIIGVPKNKNVDFSGGNGRRIFVPLSGKVKILLKEGEFDVLDANGTDGQASFQLPEPDSTDDGITDYSVYIRGLGKPGGSATMQSCFYDQQTATEYCSTTEYIVNVSAHGNNNKFQNVTNQLLYVWADVDGDGDLDRVELFSDDLDTYYWYYDNQGLKLAQLRFYPNVGTPVEAPPTN
ncbi:MAG TPA: hypothetical protein VF476_14750 [Chitinophagaceae bacterium]